MGMERPEGEGPESDTGSESITNQSIWTSTVIEKPGWRRVSTRQWLRDFRENIAKYQVYPYKTLCGGFFLTFGYYPDMVPKESFRKYQEKHPLATRKPSVNSVRNIPETATTATSATALTETEEEKSLTVQEDANQEKVSPKPSVVDDVEARLTKKKKNKKQADPEPRESGSFTTDAMIATLIRKKKKKRAVRDEGVDEDSKLETPKAKEGAEADPENTEVLEKKKKPKKKLGSL